MHPIPVTQHHEQYMIIAYIRPQTPYITVTNDKRAYSLLTEQNLGACTHTSGFARTHSLFTSPMKVQHVNTSY